MASNLNEILGRNVDSVKALKTAIKELQDSLVGLDSESQEYKDTASKLTVAQDALKNTTRAGVDANLAAKDSIVGMQKEYNKLYDAYKKLSDEQRNSDFGKNMAASLKTLSESINERKKEVGNFSSNIGRYAEGVTEAFGKMGISIGNLQGPLKLATNGSKGFSDVLTLISKHPIITILTILVSVLMKAAAAIKQNEELTNRLHQAMAAFQPVLDWISNALDGLAGILVKVVEGMAKVGEKILSIIPGYKEAAKSHKELAKATDDLTKAQRENSVVNSKKQADIERLREEASATEDVTEKRRLLEDAKKLQAEVDESNVELAQKELAIQEAYAEKTANSAEANDKLAASQKKVNDLTAQAERNQRQYNKQLDATKTKTSETRHAVDEYKQKAEELYNNLQEWDKTEVQKLTEKYEKEKALLEKYHLDTKLLTKKFNKEMNDLQTQQIEEAAKERQEKIEKAGQDAIDAIDKAMTRNKIDVFKEVLSFDPDLTSFKDMQNYMAEEEYTMLEQQKGLLAQELANFKGTQDQKLALLEQYYGVCEEIYNRQDALEELHKERTQEIWDAATDHFDTYTDALDSVLSTIQNVINAEIKSGKLTEEEAKRKQKALKALEAVQLAVAIASIAGNTAAGIMDVWRGYAAEMPVNAETAAATGPDAAATKAALDAKSLTAAIIKTAAIGTQGTAQIAAAIGGYIAKNAATPSEDSGAGVAATPALISTEPYSYTRTVQSVEEEDQLRAPVWVSVEDISSALDQKVVVRNESSF